MIVQFQKRLFIRKAIHDQRRENLLAEIRHRQMARVFETQEERTKRLALEKLRSQDWKS